MKTSAIILLALAALPLAATEPAAPAPATQAATPAEPTARVAQDYIDLGMELCDIVLSDRTDDEKAAAMEALKPRAKDIGSRMGAAGIEAVMREAEALVTPEMNRRIDASHDLLSENPVLYDIHRSFIELIVRTAEAQDTGIGNKARQQLAGELLRFVYALRDIAESDKSGEEKQAALKALIPRASSLSRRLTMLDFSEIDRIMEEMVTEEEGEQLEAAFGSLMRDEALAPLMEQLSNVLTGAAPEAPTREAMQTAGDMLELMKQMDTLMLADTSVADKKAALEALRPRAVEIGQRVHALSFPCVTRACRSLMQQTGGEPEFEGLNKACDASPELGELIEELTEIMRAMPARIPADAAPAQVATDFMSKLNETLTRLQAPGTLPWEQADILEAAMPQLMLVQNWAMESGRGPELHALLKASDEFQLLVHRHRFVQNLCYGDSRLSEAAQLYLTVLDGTMSSLQQDETHTPEAGD